jgi:hypothetical protein
MMKEVHLLVTEQGEHIDSIENNVQVTKIKVDEGLTEIKKVRFCLFLFLSLSCLPVCGSSVSRIALLVSTSRLSCSSRVFCCFAQAEEYQNKSRRKQCCILFLLLVVAGLIVLGVMVFKK